MSSVLKQLFGPVKYVKERGTCQAKLQLPANSSRSAAGPEWCVTGWLPLEDEEVEKQRV